MFSIYFLDNLVCFCLFTMAMRRLQQDFRQLLKNKVEGIDASPSADNLFIWNELIFGPEGSIYESGVFQLQLIFPEDYPLRPPQARFMTKVFHPNVWWEDGRICVDILKDGWTPSYDILAILHSIRLLLIDPNPLSPANLEAALLFRDNRAEYNRRVSELIQDALDADEDEEEDQDKEAAADDVENDRDEDNKNEVAAGPSQADEGDLLREKTIIHRQSITE